MSSQKKPHQQFMSDTKSILLSRLAYARSFPVGSWVNRFTRPDIVIVQEPASGRPDIQGVKSHQGFYDQVYLVECKINPRDLENAPYQLLLAMGSFRGQGMLDLAHGGVRPTLAVPRSLEESMNAEGAFNQVIEIFRELHFGLIIVDQERRDYTSLLWSESFMGG
ncbi:MAG TPA: hypothetical protein VGR53_06980 [Nitrososphaerales archaeon]|nr:hypothetical protein [Nitrososphaerales archaeon]